MDELLAYIRHTPENTNPVMLQELLYNLVLNNKDEAIAYIMKDPSIVNPMVLYSILNAPIQNQETDVGATK